MREARLRKRARFLHINSTEGLFHMKRMFALLLSAALLLSLLPACNQQAAAAPTQPVEPDGAGPGPTVSEPADSVLPQKDLSASDVLLGVWATLGSELANAETYGITDGDNGDMLPVYIEGAYGLSAGEWDDAALARETGASAVELAVLRFADEDGARHGEDCLKDYLHSREGDFTGYAPDQAKLVADAALCREGKYVGLFIVPASGLSQRTFIDIVKTGKVPEQATLAAEAEAVLDYLLERCPDVPEDTERRDSSDFGALAEYIEAAYGLSQDQWEDGAVVRGLGSSAFELLVLQVKDKETAWLIESELVDYLDDREGVFTGYAPDQAELLHQSTVYNAAVDSTELLIMPVCKNADELVIGNLMTALHINSIGNAVRKDEEDEEDAGATSLNGENGTSEPDTGYPNRVKFTPPNKDDMSLYDTSAIRSAWASGDPSGLSDYDRETYDAAQAILGEILTDGMTDLEKETAVYYWLVNNVDYDWRHQDIMAKTPRSSYEPHGGLVDYTAVCLGYATSFQLLMDLAGVECITVPGAAFHSEEDHGWNMVRLNGDWYCVDVTWDANYREQLGTGEPENWRYFNVTSDWMAERNHQWDYANTPEATAEDRGQG